MLFAHRPPGRRVLTAPARPAARRWLVGPRGPDGAAPGTGYAPRTTGGVALGPALLAAYAFLLPVQIPVGEGRFAPADLCLLTYLVLWFPTVRYVPRGWSRWHGALVGLFGVGLAVAFAHDGTVSGYALVSKAVGLVFLLVGYAVLLGHCADAGRTRRLLRWFLVGVVVNAAVASAVYVLQVSGVVSTDLVNYANARVSGLLVDPNAFGGIVVVALVLHVWTARTADPLWVWERGRALVGVVLLLTLALTFSRSAWIAFLCAVSVAFVLRGVRGTRALPQYYLAALAAGAALVVALQPGLLSLALRPDQVTGRLDILRDAFVELQRSPLLGIGLGRYLEEHGVIVHNTVAWFLTEFGLVGVAVLLGFLGWYLRGLWRASGRLPGGDGTLAFAVLLAQVGMLGLSVGIEAFYQRHWWLLFAVAGGIFAREASRDGGGRETAAAAEPR